MSGTPIPERSDPTLWAVFDLNAIKRDPMNPGVFIPRLHQTNTGREVALYATIPCHLPEAEARPFLRDMASYKVLDAQDQIVVGLTDGQQQRIILERLSSSQVVASLDELTVEALVTRVAMFPGGQHFNVLAPRSRLISFLATAQRDRDENNTAAPNAPDGRDRAAGVAPAAAAPPLPPDIEEMGEDEVDALTKALVPARA